MHSEPPLDRRLDPVRFLAGTETRLRILDALADGPVSRATLDADLDVPRTTLRRNLADLAERTWVEHDPTSDEYALTPAGDRARRGFRQAVSDIDTASRVGSFLGEFPADLPLAEDALDAVTVLVATDRDPHGPVSWLQSHFDGTTHAKGLLPAANPMYVTAILDRIEEGFGLDLLGSETLFESLRRDFRSDLDRLRAATDVSLSVVPDPPSYGIGLLEDHVFLVAYDDRLRSHSVARVPRSRESLAEWASERYEAVAERATPLSDWAAQNGWESASDAADDTEQAGATQSR